MPKNRNLNVNYLNRDFGSLKQDLMNYVKVYYPDRYNDFSESSVGMMLLELNAYAADMLSYHVDKTFGELFLDSAQNRDSVINLAKNLGYKASGRKPAITMLDVSIEVPPDGDAPDEDYYITLAAGMKVKSDDGASFEIPDAVEFSESTNLNGVVNRFIEPVYNNSNEIIAYKITKRVAAIAGEVKTAILEITSENSVPFLKWNIDENDTTITEVLNVISKSDRYAPVSLADWTDAGDYTAWYRVDSLPQERVFVDAGSGSTGSEGYWKYVEKRYTTEFDENGNLIITFGAGIEDYSSYEDFLSNGITGITPELLLNNDSLGEIPSPGVYMHVRYRTGGGAKTNAAAGTITTVLSKVLEYIPGGAGLPAAQVSDVISSIEVNNPIPAIGGRDFPTLDEIKAHAVGHYSAQDRCVTVDDYLSRISLLPPQYGTVFRSYAQADPESMNTRIYILTRDDEGKLKNSGNDTIKANIAAYLENYKLLNDFVIIDDGRIINLGINFAVQVEGSYNKKEVIVNCINELTNYFDISKWQMNDTIYISQIVEILRDQPGVVNVVSVDFKNKVGGDYSSDTLVDTKNLSQVVKLTQNGEVDIIPTNNKIRAPKTGMFEIKYPTKDIRGAAI